MGGRKKLAPLSTEEWVAEHIEGKDEGTRSGAAALMEILREAGLDWNVASTQGSIYTMVVSPAGKSYPFFLTKAGRCQIGFAWTKTVAALQGEEPRRRYWQRFRDAVGGLSSDNYRSGIPWFAVEKLADPECAERFRTVALEFLADCRG
jgi:hypothetical protein